jgi:hypothetical protein
MFELGCGMTYCGFSLTAYVSTQQYVGTSGLIGFNENENQYCQMVWLANVDNYGFWVESGECNIAPTWLKTIETKPMDQTNVKGPVVTMNPPVSDQSVSTSSSTWIQTSTLEFSGNVDGSEFGSSNASQSFFYCPLPDSSSWGLVVSGDTNTYTYTYTPSDSKVTVTVEITCNQPVTVVHDREDMKWKDSNGNDILVYQVSLYFLSDSFNFLLVTPIYICRLSVVMWRASGHVSFKKTLTAVWHKYRTVY